MGGGQCFTQRNESINTGEILGNNSLLDGGLKGNLSGPPIRWVLPVANTSPFLSPAPLPPFPSICSTNFSRVPVLFYYLCSMLKS